MSALAVAVKNGKVTQEFVPGYPQRFAHGDRQSPFQDGDLERYLGIRGRSAAISTAISHLNEKLDLLKVGDIYKGRQEQITQRIYDHIKKHPLEPLYQQVEAWGGPVGGFNLAATRHVSTGTYFGSSAPIQLVDNMSVAARLGYFMALDGVPTITPMGGANIMVMRDYTHVRPLLSIKEGTKVPWQDLVIPLFMNKLSKVLSSKDLVKSEDGKTERQPLDAFLTDLREERFLQSRILWHFRCMSNDVFIGCSTRDHSAELYQFCFFECGWLARDSSSNKFHENERRHSSFRACSECKSHGCRS